MSVRAFVIAMEREAEAVRPHLKPTDRLVVSGVGKVNAAAATMKAICEGADEIWNAGLAGGFGSDVAVGDIYGVSDAAEYDFDLAKINGVGVGVPDGLDSPFVRLAKIPDLVNEDFFPPWFKGYRTLATGDHFTDDEGDYDLITRILGASLRDMEGAAIAYVCKRENVKCLALKCVTNVAGLGPMTEQYLANREACLERLGEAMAKIIRCNMV